jgi:photosystem II stability/assembly factor-like uncharacterized protein
MKSIFFLSLSCLEIFLLVFPKISLCQEWEWMTPKPQGNDLYSIIFTNGTTGYAVGKNGTIIKTTNNGDSWFWQTSGTKQSLKNVCFLDENIGFTVGWGGTILKTSNAGATWESIPSGTDAPLREITFTDDGVGYIVGYNGTILKSTDSGNTWSKIDFNNSYLLEAISFINNYYAYAVGVEGALIRTINSGVTWEDLNFNLSLYTNDIYFLNADTGFIATGDGLFCTYDGGASWLNFYGNSNCPVSSIFFINDSTGFAASPYARILKTNDYGHTWSLDTVADEYDTFISIFFHNSQNGIAVGYGGQITKTEDGQNWINKSERVSYSFYDMNFVNSDTGYLAGDSNIIYVTKDGGLTFRKCYTGADDFLGLFRIEVPKENVIIASGLLGEIAKSTDDGYTWSVIETGIWIEDIYFATEDTGFAIEYQIGTILKTTDGGNTWATIHPGFGVELYDIQFVDNQHGFISGESCLVVTDDGGDTWQKKEINANKPLFGYHFVNNNVGYAGCADSAVFKTVDGGDTWLEIPLDTWYAVQSISFLNPDTGYVLKHEGEIFFTTDGGNTWTRQFANTEMGIQIKITDINTAYILGFSGELLKFKTSLAGIFNHNQSSTIDIAVYPNPVQQECILHYMLPKRSYIEITMFATHGNRVNILFRGNSSQGNHDIPIDFKNLPSGAYIIKVQTDYGSFSKKVVLK